MENKKRTTVVRVLTLLLFLAVVIVAGIMLSNKKNEIEQLNSQNANLNTTIEQRDSIVNDLANTFDEIEKNLTFVRNKRGQLAIEQKEGGKNQKELVVADIKLMNEMLEESSKKIDELDKKLKSSGVEIKSFRNKIAQLNKSIMEQDESIQQLKAEIELRDTRIAELDTQVMDLRANVVSKEDSILKKSEIIVQKDNQMNKAYFAAGSYDELSENGVLTKEGGFLGIGKSKAIKSDLNETYFTELDMRDTKQLPIFTKKAKIISEHPDSSYKFVHEDDQITYLEIENPDEFWKLTKYVIVETK